MNLDLIKQEIDSRKKEKNHIAESTGIDIPMAKDNFLYGLCQSLATGIPNQATAKLKVVNERSENMEVSGGQIVNKNSAPANQQVINEMAQTTARPNVNPQNPNAVDPNAIDPREEQFYRNLQESRQIVGGNPNNNVGMADAMAMYQKQPTPQQIGNGMIQSPNALNEAVGSAVNNYFANIDLPKLVEDIVKTTMMELYRKEKVEAAINENQDMIQKMVVNTILALKKRNTAKK